MYQSGAAAVEVAIADSLLAGADHWEVWRTKAGGSPVLVLPSRLSAATTAITDRGPSVSNPADVLESGASYTYNVVVSDGVSTHPYPAAPYDVGNRVETPLTGSSITLGTAFGFDPRPGHTGERFTNWAYFPEPIGSTYAKYFGAARRPSTNAALGCATVTVKEASTDQLATLFLDQYGSFTHTNPMTADLHGAFEFYAANGTYKITVELGTISYTLNGVQIFDARAPNVLRSDLVAAMTLVTKSTPATPPDGNIHLKFTRPNSFDFFNNPGDSFYRLLANQNPFGLALTYNLKVPEASGEMTMDEDSRPAFYFRVNPTAKALEFAVDPAYRPDALDGVGGWSSRALGLETLMHVGPDRAHFKAFLGPVGIQGTAVDAGIRTGRVVAFDADGVHVRLTTADRQANPYVVLGVDEPDGVSVVGSRVFVGVTGRVPAFVKGAVALGDPLVSTADGYAMAAPAETDARYIGAYSNSPGASSPGPYWIWSVLR